MTSWRPSLDSLAQRLAPDWFDQAKFGIFIHWGVFAIPGFAPRLGSIGDAFRKDYDRAVAMTPYTEWYWNASKVAGTPTQAFHKEHYGEAPYQAFKAPFLEGLKQWQPAAWAEAFRDAGAKYVVLVTKHHDGFCLWPSSVENRHERDWNSGRDIVGELAAAVRSAGLRFGVYYSGGIDWTFNREPMRTLADFMGSTPGGDYPAYAMAQTRELIERYQPSVLWNDIAWPTGERALYRLFADYYNAVPDGVVNDRWVAMTPQRRRLRLKSVRRALDERLKASFARNPDAGHGVIPQPIPHSDFRTPEYTGFSTTQEKKWEATRGMSFSFGFNRNDTEADYAPFETLLGDFIDGVSRNGNLLLNVGPRGTDARIPDEQLSRLKQFGAWLKLSGDAIYGTRPWERSDGETSDGTPVRFTTKDGVLNLIFKAPIRGERVVVRDLEAAGPAHLLADGSPVALEQQGPDLALTFKRPPGSAFAPVVAVG